MIKAISNIALVVLFLVSTTGMVISEHICMGERQSSGLYGMAQECGMNADTPCANHSGKDSKGCCENESEYIDGIDLETSVIAALELPVKFDVVVVELPMIAINSDNTFHSSFTYTHFHPPPLLRDIPVLLQSFLF